MCLHNFITHSEQNYAPIRDVLTHCSLNIISVIAIYPIINIMAKTCMQLLKTQTHCTTGIVNHFQLWPSIGNCSLINCFQSLDLS